MGAGKEGASGSGLRWLSGGEKGDRWGGKGIEIESTPPQIGGRRRGGQEEEEEEEEEGGEAGRLGGRERKEWGAAQDDADTRCDASTPFYPSASTRLLN